MLNRNLIGGGGEIETVYTPSNNEVHNVSILWPSDSEQTLEIWLSRRLHNA